MNTIIHNFKIVRRFFILYFKEKTIFPSEAIISILDFLITILSTIIFWISLKTIGVRFTGWGFQHIMLMVGFNFLSTAINSLFFGFRDLEYRIISGEFDSMMTKGINPFLIVILNKMNFLYILFNLIFGIFAIIYCIVNYKLSLFYSLIAVLVSILSTLVLSFIYSIFSLLAFKIGEIYYIRELAFSFLKAKEYPADIYPKAVYNFFIYVIPLALISTIPVKIAFQIEQYKIYLSISILLFLLTVTAFKILSKKAIESYSSTGN